MRPLTARILSTNEETGLRLKLESGLVTTLPYNKFTLAGEKVLISYDFTKNQVNGILHDTEDQNDAF